MFAEIGRTDFTACNKVVIKFPSLFCATIVACVSTLAIIDVCGEGRVDDGGTSVTVCPGVRGGNDGIGFAPVAGCVG